LITGGGKDRGEIRRIGGGLKHLGDGRIQRGLFAWERPWRKRETEKKKVENRLRTEANRKNLGNPAWAKK